MKARFQVFSCITLISVAALISCGKKEEKVSNILTQTEAASNNAFAEAQYNDVTTLVDQAGRNGATLFGASGTGSGSGINSLLNGCASLSVDTVSSPRSITIDFGTSNCLCLDGRNRRGKIIATYTGKYRDSGTVISISFDNYYVNDNKISGTKQIINQGFNGSGNLVYKIIVNGQVIKANNMGTVTWVSTRYREWKEGYNTPLNILDDVYSITGDANGTNHNGTPYTITITHALVRKMNCRWFESGVLSLTITGLPEVSLDYGTTGCDPNATVIVLGQSYPVVLQ
jgi:hypothetical protein